MFLPSQLQNNKTCAAIPVEEGTDTGKNCNKMNDTKMESHQEILPKAVSGVYAGN
jgi:hypothetical protein